MCGCACGGAWRSRNWRHGQTRGVVSVYTSLALSRSASHASRASLPCSQSNKSLHRKLRISVASSMIIIQIRYMQCDQQSETATSRCNSKDEIEPGDVAKAQRLCSKSVRRLDQWDLRDLESLRPLVASSLRSERYSSGPSGF